MSPTTSPTTSPQVDAFLANATRWQAEMAALRQIVLSAGLTETVKWRLPCYTLDNKNVVIIQTFKDYAALMFFKGALLSDANHMLETPGQHMQAGRQLRFNNVSQIQQQAPIIKAYVQEAIEAEKAGLQVEMKETADYPVPEEFQVRLDASPDLKAAFEALTPGRQRAYLLHFGQAKQSKTRAARVEKHAPRILAGKGLSDR